MQCSAVQAQHSIAKHSTIQYNTVQCNAMQCSAVAVQFSTVQAQHNTAQHNTIQYNTTQQYSTIQYNTIQYKTIQHSIVLYKNAMYVTGENKIQLQSRNKTEQTLANQIKHNGNYIYLVRLFTKIIIFVFTKLERPFLCPAVLSDHCSDLWQTTYFKRDKSALQDLKDQVLVCSYYKKGSLWRPRDDLGWYSCCTLFTVRSETSTLESNQIVWSLTVDRLQ